MHTIAESAFCNHCLLIYYESSLRLPGLVDGCLHVAMSHTVVCFVYISEYVYTDNSV